MKNIIAQIQSAVPTLIKRGVALGITMSLLNVSLAVAMPKTLVDGAAALHSELAVSSEVSLLEQSREITVSASIYNPGDVNQTDSTPCHGPTNNWVCNVDQRIIAANFLKLGQKVLLPTIYGDEVVTNVDRMNARYQEGFIDIALYLGDSPEQMAAAKAQALRFGRQDIPMIILD